MQAFLHKTILCLSWLFAGIFISAPAYSATYLCKTTAMNGNSWICNENPDLCTFHFTGSARSKTLIRKQADKADVSVVVDKWEDKIIIAHEDRPRIDSLVLEQYYYKIERDTGNFLMANEYVTNSGRYLTKEDLAADDRKRYSFHKPKLFSETGRCSFKAKN